MPVIQGSVCDCAGRAGPQVQIKQDANKTRIVVRWLPAVYCAPANVDCPPRMAEPGPTPRRGARRRRDGCSVRQTPPRDCRCWLGQDWAQMMTDPGLAGEIGNRFDYVLVDEYQDTNRLQASILLALKPSGSGLTVVGDDAQSIYSCRAATVRNILDFPGQFSPPAEIVTLDRNYRSTQPILAAANGLIELASERYTKNLWTDRTVGELPQLVWVRDEVEQVCYVIERVLENREAGLTLRQQAILFRASHHSGPLEVELTRRNIPSSNSAS
jgi:hypothetical protein